MSVQVDRALYSAEVTYCGVNVEPIWNPDRTEVLVEPGRALLATYDVTNLGDEELVVFVKTFRTVDDEPEEPLWNSPKRIKPGETISDFARNALDPAWGPDTEFECRIELWTM